MKLDTFLLAVLAGLIALRLLQARKAQAETISYLDALGEMLGESLDQKE